MTHGDHSSFPFREMHLDGVLLSIGGAEDLAVRMRAT